VIDFLDWVARAGGMVAILFVTLGFVFREKWKQILQRSLSEDIERLKSELVKSQAEHAASLTPQLEQIKHDFQQKLEAYKVSLIAQTEAVKAREELRKTIALRYAEIEFERLVAFERAAGPITSYLLSLATVDVTNKSVEDSNQALHRLRSLGVAADEAEMFISSEDRVLIIELQQRLLAVASDHIGYQKPVLTQDWVKRSGLLELSCRIHSSLKQRIGEIGRL
jgi:hypothetical protein